MAILISELSHCERRKVGCVIVKDDRVISFGYNGTPAQWDNVCEDEDGNTKSEVMHSESNALSKLAKCNESGQDAILFVTTIPCMECAKLIKQSGIKEVYYLDKYRKSDGEDFLIKCGITPLKVELDEKNM